MKKNKANTYIKPSSIHGLGVFASRGILKGESIIQGKPDYKNYLSEFLAYNRNNEKSYGFENGYCMINHSETPNTFRKKNFCIIANRNIFADEEITEDYNALPDKHNPFKTLSLDQWLKNLWNES